MENTLMERSNSANEQLAQELFIEPKELIQWDSLDSGWNKIALSSEQVDPFCCLTSWQLSFHEVFSPIRRLLIKESSGSIIAFAEEISTDGSVALTPIEAHWMFGSPLLGPDAIDLLIETFGDLDNYYGSNFPRIFISGISDQGEEILEQSLVQALKLDAQVYDMTVECSASLDGGLDGFLSRRSKRHRRNLRKQTNRARSKEVRFERHRPESIVGAHAVYVRMISVEFASWKGVGKCGMAESPSKEYYEAMLKRLSVSKDARVIFARHEDQDIGYIFGGMAENIYRGQQFSFDQKWSSDSIGNLLQLEQVKWLCEEGANRYDLGPVMEYKKHWTENTVKNHTWVLEKR